jgi:hypothetical protein
MAGRSSRSTDHRAAGLLPKAGRSSRRQSRPTRPCIQGMNRAELLARVRLAALDEVDGILDRIKDLARPVREFIDV